MLILAPLLVGALAGLLLRGRLSNWVDVHFRWPWVVVLVLFVREAVALTPLGRIDELRFVYVAFLLVLFAWTVWHYYRLPAVWLLSIGAGLNLVVILANGARMPVAAEHAGRLVQLGHVGQYVLMDSSTRLAWLGDWIAAPEWLGGVYSPGDVIIGLGTGIVAFLVTRRRPPARDKLDAKPQDV